MIQSRSKISLDRIDLSTKSRSASVLAALVKLLAPHVPHSLRVLGTVLNSRPRACTTQDIDPSNVSLWSTIPLDPDATTTPDPSALFSIVVFSHVSRWFHIFCSADSRAPSEPPTDAERTHVREVFDWIREMASEAQPSMYDAVLELFGPDGEEVIVRRTTAGTPTRMIIVGAVHARWKDVLAPMAVRQGPWVQYVFPPEWRASSGASGPDPGLDVTASQIQASDLPFVHGASSVPYTDAYLMSRTPYSVCLRTAQGGRPVACAYLHSEGCIGGVRVDPAYQRQGLGRLLVRTLIDALDFAGEGRGESAESEVEVSSDDLRDLGGGALGWNWLDTGVRNETSNRFFTSLVGKGNGWLRHWTFIPIGEDDTHPS